METLNFTKVGTRYVSDAIEASSVTVHMKLPDTDNITVERTANEEHGWAPVATRHVIGIGLFEESIVGIPTGVKVRIVSNFEPLLAEVLVEE